MKNPQIVAPQKSGRSARYRSPASGGSPRPGPVAASVRFRLLKRAANGGDGASRATGGHAVQRLLAPSISTVTVLNFFSLVFDVIINRLSGFVCRMAQRRQIRCVTPVALPLLNRAILGMKLCSRQATRSMLWLPTYGSCARTCKSKFVNWDRARG